MISHTEDVKKRHEAALALHHAAHPGSAARAAAEPEPEPEPEHEPGSLEGVLAGGRLAHFAEQLRTLGVTEAADLVGNQPPHPPASCCDCARAAGAG